MFSNSHRNSATLDAEPYKNDPKVYELACVIRDEVAMMLPSKERPRAPSKNALVDLLNGQAMAQPWHYHVTDIGLLRRSAARLGCSMRETVERIRTELFPPNWETLFWLQAYLEAVADSVNAEIEFAQREAEAKRLARSELARQNGAKAHSENRAMKMDVFAWLDENMVRFNSMDSAAQEISTNVAPVAFRTARDWVGQWKKVRSAGTP